MKRLVTLSTLLFAACGDDKGAGNHPDAAVSADSTDAAVDSPPQFVTPTPFVIDISPTGPDQLMSVVPGPSGSFYAAGYAAQTATGAKYLIAAKLTAAGALDTTFGTGGVFTSTVELKGGSDEIDLVVQSTGALVISGTIANLTNAADRDLGLIRVDATGALDSLFGGTGLARLDLSTAYDNNGTLQALDSARGLALGPNDTLFVHAVSRGAGTATGGGPRTDTDFTVAKLSADGVLDLTWAGGDGTFTLDIQESNATAKGIQALADGSVIGGGYASSPGVGSTQPVLYRLTSAGALDTGFATQGLFHESVLALQTEIYSFAIHGDKLTTAGYGRNTGTANDWVSLRFDASTGVRDTAFGGAASGAVMVDPSGTMAGSNCRNAIALPGGKTALIGSTGAAGARDAALAILTQNGQLDTTFGTGVHTFELTGTEDQWWGGAVSGGKLLIAGWRGVGATQTDGANDNSYGVLVEL